MASDTLNNNDRSPCLVCPHRDMDKNKCSLLCLRLAAYNSGEPWGRKPLPYIAKGNQASSLVSPVKEGTRLRTRLAGESEQEATPVRKEVVKMEETEIRDQKSEVRDQKKREYHKTTVQPGSVKQARGFLNKEAGRTCLIDDCDKKDRLIRGLCPKHYQAWRKGRIKHPFLGEFTVWQAKSQIKPVQDEEKPEVRGRKSEIREQKDQNCKKATDKTLPGKLEYVRLGAGLIIDLDKFPKIKTAVYDTAEKYFVTPEHIVIGLLGEALAGRNQKSEVSRQKS